MACYRLTFHNNQVFDVVIDPAPVHGSSQSNVRLALIYRVVAGHRDAEPLQRTGGGPIQVLAVSQQTAVDIVKEVLREVTGSRLEAITECGPHPFAAPVPNTV